MDTVRRAKDASLAGAENFRIESATPGLVESIAIARAARRPPAPGEVLIQVEAAALNFKDLLITLGMMPADRPPPVPLGLECAGRVAVVGEDVQGLSVGDEVMAVGSECLAAFVTLPARRVRRKPAHLSMVESATLLGAFVTALLGIHELAGLRPGERILIHAAAGGVGLAAVQLAQRLGAEVLATAGSDEKRAYLRSIGVRHVMSSRTADFAAQVMDVTSGRGVDVILNSLGGDVLAKNLSILAPHGRFVELGMRDVLANARLELSVFEKGISFCVMGDGGQHPRLQARLDELVERFERRELTPLPHRVFPLRDVARAFEHMAQAKHIGRVVLAMRDPESLRELGFESAPVHARPAQAEPAPVRNALLRSDIHAWISPREGVEVFRRLLAGSCSQVVVSTRPIERRLRQRAAQKALAHMDERQPHAAEPTHSRPALGTEYVAPRDDVEMSLAALWQGFFNIDCIGIRDDFFQLGGDSLVAVQLLAKMRRALNIDLPPHTIVEAPTIEALRARIPKAHDMADAKPNDTDAPPCLVKIRPGSAQRRPLFLIHPAGGLVYFYRELVSCLDPEQTVYGLQAHGLERDPAEFDVAMEEMARQYLDAVRKVQPEGPYLLGGSSFGGIMAYEIAQQLLALGQETRLLFMVDSPGPGYLPEGLRDELEILCYLMNGRAADPSLLERARRMPLDAQLPFLIQQANSSTRALPTTTLDELRRFLRLFQSNVRIIHEYTPRPYPGRVLFFRAAEADGVNNPNPELAWKALAAGGLEVHEVPGTHITMNLLPHARALAEKLSRPLYEAAIEAG